MGGRMSDLHDKWEADGMREQMYTHPYLNSSSIVLEIGAYKGFWISEISKRYDPCIYAFEPVPQFYTEAQGKIKDRDFPKVFLFPFGLGKDNRMQAILVNEDASGVYCKVGVPVQIFIRSIKEALSMFHFKEHINLTQINCEGGEYELLEYILNENLINKFDHLQIQFHDIIPDAKMRMENIFHKLSETHKMHYNYDFIFCHWSKK